jgi:hypothetical protein
LAQNLLGHRNGGPSNGRRGLHLCSAEAGLTYDVDRDKVEDLTLQRF